MQRGLSVAEARTRVLAETPLLGPETVASADALGRVLAAPIAAQRTLPPADCSAMDGYAVKADDLARAERDRPVVLRVVYEVAAGGQAPRELVSGEAARIFTGAPIPPGADAVVRQEDTEGSGASVQFLVVPKGHEHIRDAGEDVREGDVVLEPGHLIRSAELGLLASLGRSTVAVHQRPRVAILSGGDELIEPDGNAAGGKIVSSNSYMLAAQCREAGAEPVYLGIARDRPENLEEMLRAGLRADVLVSSAGVSVGDHDHVRDVLAKLGCQLHFWGVRMKPGFPVTFGTFAEQRGPLVFGLPGNPVSASVTFEQFARPALLKLAGRSALFRPTLRARLAEGLQKKVGRLHFVRVSLRREGQDVIASIAGNQSSGVMRSLTQAQGLLIFPEDETSLSPGDEATVQVIDDDFFAGRSAGF